MNDRELHARLIGQQGSRTALNTPALIVDLAALTRNIAAMAATMRAAGVALRPHAKTHKSVEIARLQMAAGATGICCAKIGEAEVLAAGGIDNLLITSPVASPMAIDRLAALAEAAPTTIATLDDPLVAARTDAALAASGAVLDVLIDIDPGSHRTGVASAGDAVALARTIASLSNLRLRGVQFYCGPQQHIPSFTDRRAAVADLTAYLRSVIAALAEAGFAPGIVSGSGTGTHLIDLELGVMTECQPGSYVFMDRQYRDCDLTGDGAGCPFETALMVDTRVVSANHADLVTIDAGFKALSTDGGEASVLGAHRDARFVFMGDEHAALHERGIGVSLRPGEAVTLTVPHCDPTVNLYDSYHVISGDTLVDIWDIGARGRSR